MPELATETFLSVYDGALVVQGDVGVTVNLPSYPRVHCRLTSSTSGNQHVFILQNKVFKRALHNTMHCTIPSLHIHIIIGV